jgi:para-nitrobenzyl esterase
MMMRKHVFAGILLSALFAPFLTEALAESLCSQPVETSQGLVQGKDDPKNGACVWKGIPYAKPPVGNLRWRAPEPPEPHQGIFEAYEFGPACPQNATITSGGEFDRFSEDCLYLNIWRPSKSGSFPVMYWIHGGAFRQGTGSYEMSNGARLANEREVVVVTINYRLGGLGFLSLPELASESPHQSAGNYGFLDQIEGLKWVQKNIAGFGGDPNNVTIFGQSAGGMSVCALLASPLARGLFHRAISMSGACEFGATREKAYEQGKKFAEQVGCKGSDRLQCLRKLPAEKMVPKGENLIVSAISGKTVIPSPSIDGYVLKDQPINLIRQGDYNKMPVMLGHTRDEVKLYTILMPGLSLLPPSFFNHLLRRFMGDEIFKQVMNYYSYSDYKHPSQCAFAIVNDAFISRGYIAAEALAGQSQLYLWRFDWDDTRFKNKVGAFHGLDEPFVFGALEMQSRLAKLLASKKSIELGRPLTEKIMSYYTNFAKTGNPNGPGLPEWPAYTLEKKERLYFDNQLTVAPLTEKEIQRYNLFANYNMLDLAI